MLEWVFVLSMIIVIVCLWLLNRSAIKERIMRMNLQIQYNDYKLQHPARDTTNAGGFTVPDDFARQFRDVLRQSTIDAASLADALRSSYTVPGFRPDTIELGTDVQPTTQSVYLGGGQVPLSPGSSGFIHMGMDPAEAPLSDFHYEVKAEKAEKPPPKFKQKEERPKRLIDIN